MADSSTASPGRSGSIFRQSPRRSPDTVSHSPNAAESPGFDFPLTQLPVHSSQCSQTDQYSSQCSQRFNFWQGERTSVVSFDLDTPPSQVIRESSQVDELTCCSQTRNVAYQWETLKSDATECVPRYLQSVLARMRRNDTLYSPRGNLFSKQSEVTEAMRKEVIYWMISTSPELGISSKALFLAVRIVDRMLLIEDIEKTSFFSISIACLSVAVKFEKQIVPQARAYVRASGEELTEEDLIQREMDIMNNLNFQLNMTTPLLFLKLYLNEINGTLDMAMASVFLGLCTLTSPALAVTDCELVAIGILAIVMKAVKGQTLTKYIDKYSEEKLTETCKLIVDVVNDQLKDPESPIKGMFAMRERASVATRFVYNVPTF